MKTKSSARTSSVVVGEGSVHKATTRWVERVGKRCWKLCIEPYPVRKLMKLEGTRLLRHLGRIYHESLHADFLRTTSLLEECL